MAQERSDLYDSLLNEGEVWYNQHDRFTIMELKDAVNIFEIARRLGNVFWEDIYGIHATNYRSIGAITQDFNNHFYGNAIGVGKPSLSLLKWIVSNIEIACNDKLINPTPEN